MKQTAKILFLTLTMTSLVSMPAFGMAKTLANNALNFQQKRALSAAAGALGLYGISKVLGSYQSTLAQWFSDRRNPTPEELQTKTNAVKSTIHGIRSTARHLAYGAAAAFVMSEPDSPFCNMSTALATWFLIASFFGTSLAKFASHPSRRDNPDSWLEAAFGKHGGGVIRMIALHSLLFEPKP